MATQEQDLPKIHEIAQQLAEKDGISFDKEAVNNFVFKAKNLDEVLNEVIEVKVLHFKEVDVTDDDGEPLINPETGKPFQSRTAKTRTARIQNKVPQNVYNQMIAKRNLLTNGSEDERIPLMKNLVWQIWQLSEPWFTEKMFNECVNIMQTTELFTRFFNPSRL